MINANDFLSHAQSLIEKNNAKEVDFRSAISRAYYSLYHESFRFLQKSYKEKLIRNIESYVFKTKPSLIYSQEFIQKIKELDPDYILKLGISLHQIIPSVLSSLNYDYFLDYKQHRRRRNVANYDLDVNITYDDAKDEIEFISLLISSINSL